MKKLKALAAYVYAGGFSLGVKPYIPVIAHLEDAKPYGKEVIDLNREKYWHDLPIYPFGNWPDLEADLFFSNPPCAPFSNANTGSFRGGWRGDERLVCWDNVINYIVKNRPKIAAVETTAQCYSKAPDFLAEKAYQLNRIGYHVTIFLNNACFFGSAQNRPRVLLIASPYKLHMLHYLSFPSTTVGELFTDYGPDLKEVKNLDYFFKDIPKLRTLIAEALPGERLAKTFNRLNPNPEYNSKGQVKGRPTFGMLKLNPKGLSCVLVGYLLVHPFLKRLLSLKEYQLLGDFPLDYIFPSHIRTTSYVARGVSTKVGNWLGKMATLTLETPRLVTQMGVTIHQGIKGYDLLKEYNIKGGTAEEMAQQFPKLSLRTPFYEECIQQEETF